MKKIVPLLTVILIVAIIVIIFLSMSNKKQMIVIEQNNHTHSPVDIKLNHYQDTQCGMTITSTKHSAQAVSKDGRTWFFDDIGCMTLWYENVKNKNDIKFWVFSNDTNKYIDAKTAWYKRTDSTPMGYGLGAYENKQDKFIDFETMLLKMLRNENLNNPYTKKELLGN